MVLFIRPYKSILSFQSVNEKSMNVTIQMKVTEQYCSVLLFIRPSYEKLILTFQFVNGILEC